MAAHIATFDTSTIEAVARILGGSMTGTQVGMFLAATGAIDADGPTQTKWKRIYNALAERQVHDGAGNVVVRFITESMAPVRFTGESSRLDALRTELNLALAYRGLCVRDDGKVARLRAGPATTLDEAEQRASTVRTELARRGVHPAVLTYCKTEIFQRNNFHALFEASKGVADRVRSMTGLTIDGSELFDAAFGGLAPRLRINDYVDDSDRSEQRGFLNLLKGIHGTYRNPLAHAAKLRRSVSDVELLEALTTISMVQRRLDGAIGI